jgi:hypothetical protein
MAESTVRRTLVKSPPELWAEISDLASLARHLGDFGDIRITRLEPETTVVWEGERASGTVELEPAGWGTKVTLTAVAATTQEWEPTPAPPHLALVPNPPPVQLAAAVESEPVAEPEPEPVAAVPPAPKPEPKLGFFARLFGRTSPVVAEEPERVWPVPEPKPEPEPEPDREDDPAPDPIPLHEPDDPEPDFDPAAILTGVLDTLGAAHHRPFSRG